MQIQPLDILPLTGEPDRGELFHLRHAEIAAADIPALREALAGFLRQRGVENAAAGQAQLVLTEILSNLIKHPPMAARRLDLRARVTRDHVLLDIADDSTPFANFDAKCEEAESGPHAIVSGREGGYGLFCILKITTRLRYMPRGASADGLNHFILACPRGEGSENPSVRRKVFLIDDDPLALTVYDSMLSAQYEVISFSSADDALAAFPEDRPDLIISDLVMPEMDGICLRRALAGIEGGNDTPFIFLSGNDPAEHEAYISQLGVDDFLCKPVTQDRLCNVVSRLLHRSQQVRRSVESRFHQDITELLKPAMPEAFGPWRFSLYYTAAEWGGGDFVICNESSQSLTTVLSDVMGHDRQAKFFSYVYAGYLRSLFRLHDAAANPAEFLKQLSGAVSEDPLLEAMTMTCQCFRFAPEGTVRVASAGHPCPLLLRRGAEPQIMNVMGPLPGLVGDSIYALKSFSLAPGDKAVFMTDGFLDVFDRRGRAAEALAAHIKAHPATDPGAALWHEFNKRQQGDSRRDDATLIVAEYGG